MNIHDLYKKIVALDQPVAEAKIDECGEPMGMGQGPMSSPPPAPPSLSVNLNAQGMDNIEQLMQLITKVNPDAAPKALSPMGGNEPSIEIEPMDKTAGGLPPLKMLQLDLDKEEPEHDQDGGDIDPEGEDEPEDEAFANTPDGVEGEPFTKDTEYMTKTLAGGMNREKGQYKHSYKAGDNPMAMPESDLRAMIKAELAQRLAEAKAR